MTVKTKTSKGLHQPVRLKPKGKQSKRKCEKAPRASLAEMSLQHFLNLVKDVIRPGVYIVLGVNEGEGQILLVGDEPLRLKDGTCFAWKNLEELHDLLVEWRAENPKRIPAATVCEILRKAKFKNQEDHQTVLDYIHQRENVDDGEEDYDA